MRADGTPLQPNSLTHAFTKLRDARGLLRTGLHGLRHSHATHMLAAGIHPKIASERLGHSRSGSPSTSTPMCCRECRVRRPPALTLRFPMRYSSKM
jgi:site-specific recombinase XerD